MRLTGAIKDRENTLDYWLITVRINTERNVFIQIGNILYIGA